VRAPTDAGTWRAAWPAIAISVLVTVTIGAGIAVRRPEYLAASRQGASPDARHYILLGRNTLLRGHFSRSEHAPYVPDTLRTPAYPIVAGALDLLGGAVSISLGNLIFQVVTIVALVGVARHHFGGGAARIAGLLFATDLSIAVSNFEALSEPMFDALLMGSFLCLARSIGPAPRDERRSRHLAAAGFLLGLATLTRPMGLYIIGIDLAVLVVEDIRHRRGSRWLLGRSALLVGTALLPIAPWLVRNYVVCSFPRLTTVDSHNLVYFLGAGAWQVERGVSREDAQAMIAEEFGITPYRVAQNSFRMGRSAAEIDAELRSVWPEVVFKYPRSLLESSLMAIAKAGFSHSAGALADLLGEVWDPPGTGALLRGDAGAFRRLWSNGPFLVVAFGWQMLHLLVVATCSAVGLVSIFRRRDVRPTALLYLGVLSYLCGTIVLFGVDAYYRSRIPAMPFLCILAGYGLGSVVSACPGRRRPDRGIAAQ
jgi:4-amino-4-deoxy-L-arabinose transferase-like glycosyltransferase